MITGSRKQVGMAMAVTLFFLAVFILIAFLMDGTGDSGDSIEHYLISRFAFLHPELFLHHWGKPVFTFLSSPFSQFGFTGIKIFNCIVAAVTGYFTIQTASRMRMPLPSISIFFLFFAPVYFKYIFSGMTEHLLGLALILSVFLMMKKKITLSVLIVSFMPFMRSEGLVLMGVFALYLLVKKCYRYLPLLLTGHVIYSIVGYFYYHDLLWVFDRIPYLNLDSWYGAGHWPDFIFKLYYVVGLPLFGMLILGLVWMVINLFQKKNIQYPLFFHEELILIYGSFLAFFMAHTMFWALGIFNSMGLGRVLNSVIPLTALIGLRGLTWISNTRIRWLNSVLFYGILLFIAAFPFLGNPASLKWEKDLGLSSDQKLINEVISELKEGSSRKLYLYSHPYIGMQLGIDPYDPSQRGKISALKDPEDLPLHTVIIWDSWFSLVEEGYTLENLLTKEFLVMVSQHTSTEDPAKKIAIFVMKDNRMQ